MLNLNIIDIIHYSDEINKRDLILSLSHHSMILWDIFELENIFMKGKINCASFLKYNNQIYIFTSYGLIGADDEPYIIYDLKGNLVKKIKHNDFTTYFLYVYNNYIITGHVNGYINIYDYSKESLYYKLDNCSCCDITVDDRDEECIKLIIAFSSVKIYDFHKKILIQKIEIGLNILCLFNSDYLFGANYNKIILVNIKNGYCKELKSHKNKII